MRILTPALSFSSSEPTLTYMHADTVYYENILRCDHSNERFSSMLFVIPYKVVLTLLNLI